MNTALILSGGTGSRFGGELPKQYHQLAGKEVIAYSVEAMKASKLTERIVIAADREHVKRLGEAYATECIEGGNSRNESLRKGLDYIQAKNPTCKKIFISEAARPFLTAELIDDYFEKLDKYDAVITAQRITASLGREGEHITNRDEYYLIQAPEAFRFPQLYEHFKANSTITATNQQLPPQARVYRNFGFRNNIKITYPEDIAVAEALIASHHGQGGV